MQVSGGPDDVRVVLAVDVSYSSTGQGNGRKSCRGVASTTVWSRYASTPGWWISCLTRNCEERVRVKTAVTAAAPYGSAQAEVPVRPLEQLH